LKLEELDPFKKKFLLIRLGRLWEVRKEIIFLDFESFNKGWVGNGI